jgi:hypothetical protein
MASHPCGMSLQPSLQGSTKLHLKTPRRPDLFLLYKRIGQGSTRGKAESKIPASQSTQLRDQHLKQSPLYSFTSFETWARCPLSQLVTPTQAPRCKEIQNSPLPAGHRAFFCPNQDKPPCIPLASPSRLGTRSTHSSAWDPHRTGHRHRANRRGDERAHA